MENKQFQQIYPFYCNIEYKKHQLHDLIINTYKLLA